MIYKVIMELDIPKNKYSSNQKINYKYKIEDHLKEWIQDAIYEQLEDGEDLLFCEVMKKPVTDMWPNGEFRLVNKSTGEVV
tara:strand:- start:200 stop:442 length:243 start_codon:yes stop_codon:yes gene_type:complete